MGDRPEKFLPHTFSSYAISNLKVSMNLPLKNLHFLFIKLFCTSYKLWENCKIPHGSSGFCVCCLVFWVCLHYIQCNKKVKGTPKFVIKNLHFCLLNFFYLLCTLSEIQKNSYGINLTSRFKFLFDCKFEGIPNSAFNEPTI